METELSLLLTLSINVEEIQREEINSFNKIARYNLKPLIDVIFLLK